MQFLHKHSVCLLLPITYSLVNPEKFPVKQIIYIIYILYMYNIIYIYIYGVAACVCVKCTVAPLPQRSAVFLNHLLLVSTNGYGYILL